MEYTVEMASDDMMCVSSFKKIYSDIQVISRSLLRQPESLQCLCY
jgi:hypothetical protein